MQGEIAEWVPLALILFALLYFVLRRKQKGPVGQRPKLGYLAHAEPADDADAEFRACFDGMIPAQAEGLMLMRLSIANHGDGAASADGFQGPIQVSLPAGTEILAAEARQATGAVDLAALRLEWSRAAMTLHPFPLPGHSSVIVNIVAQGPVEPYELTGAHADCGPFERRA